MGVENVPKHVAMIMDGNRRWAREKGLDYRLGHKQGAKTLENIVRYAKKIGIKYITVYAFSTENWKRSEEEVGALMLLLKTYLDDYGKRADTENIKIKILGDVNVLSNGLQKSIANAVERTKDNEGITFSIALNYGGRDEIVHAIKKIAEEVKEGNLEVSEINEDIVSDSLYTKGIPDPDLVIRTSGELRTSGFLTWQAVYSEYLFLDKYWPDFSEEDLDLAVAEFQKRKRNFGAG
ncbi:MAG: isoprenyl transferase [Clostridia bacterium]|nr:isoprenyl transferase [Clostridia bacterium]